MPSFQNKNTILSNSLFAGHEQRLKGREWVCGPKVEGGRRDELGEKHCHVYTPRCRTGSWRKAAVSHRELRLALRDDLEAWNRGGGGGPRRRGYM